MTVDSDHAFVDVGYTVQKGKLVRYVRCTKCGLLLEKGKLPVPAPTVQ